MDAIITMYCEQLLWGNRFLSEYKLQLEALYSNNEFMAIIHGIQRSTPSEEDSRNIEEIKRIAKATLYNERVTFDFAALQEIVNSVKASGCAVNSALISVYCAMRIFELSQKKTSQDENIVPASNSDMDIRLKWPAEYRCDDGHYVRSKNEMLVDNWLYHHGICHAYEVALFSKELDYTYLSDFYLPKYRAFIEVWGMTDADYQRRRRQKTAFYRNNGYDLIEIIGQDVKNLHDILSKELCQREHK